MSVHSIAEQRAVDESVRPYRAALRDILTELADLRERLARIERAANRALGSGG